MQELGWGHIEAAFALHGLHDHGGHAAGFDVVFEDVFNRLDRVVHAHAVQRVGEAGVEDLGGEGAKAGFVGHDLARQAQREQGAAVVAATKRDHAGAAGVGAGDLDGVFHGLGAGGQEQGFLGEVAGGFGVDALGQFHIRLIGQDLEAGVGVVVELVFDRLDDFGVAVAGVEHGNAARKVDETAAFHVPNLGIFAALDEDGVAEAHATRNGGLAAGE